MTVAQPPAKTRERGAGRRNREVAQFDRQREEPIVYGVLEEERDPEEQDDHAHFRRDVAGGQKAADKVGLRFAGIAASNPGGRFGGAAARGCRCNLRLRHIGQGVDKRILPLRRTLLIGNDLRWCWR